MKKLVVIASLLACVYGTNAKAQCAMCAINAEEGHKNGNTQSNSINAGVFYLLGLPFGLAAMAGSVWYFKFRPKA